jgi:hypothetical protein
MISEKKKEKYFCMAAERGDLPERLKFESLEFESFRSESLRFESLGKDRFWAQADSTVPGEFRATSCRANRTIALPADLPAGRP